MIGVFDSGYGGLGVLSHLMAACSQADWVYLGDSGRAPYGGRDVHTILDFSELAVERLFSEGCSVIVVACNTVSCIALRHLQQRYCGPETHRRILGVTIPAAEMAVATGARRIGVVATQRTIDSGTFPAEIRKLSDAEVHQRSARLLAGIVEEGWEDSNIAREAVARYLEGIPDLDALVLGCTHYPFLRDAFEATVDCPVLDPAPFVAQRLVDWFARHPDYAPRGSGELRILCTGTGEAFARHGARFLGRQLPHVEHIAKASPRGQVVR